MAINITILGQRVRSARKQRDMAAEDLSWRVGITPESLGHIECGARKPSLQTLYAIAEVLEVSMDYLLGRTTAPAESVIHACAQESYLLPHQEQLLKELTRSVIPIIKTV